MKISEEEMKRAAREIYFWQYSNTGCFHNQLFDLFGKADPNNFVKLSEGFPAEAQAWLQWQAAANYGNEFFKKYGVVDDEREKAEEAQKAKRRIRTQREIARKNLARDARR